MAGESYSSDRTRRETLDAGHSLAATSFSAGDSICGARTDRRAAGGDHGQTATLLNQAGRKAKEAVRVLTRLMQLKNRAEYEPEDVPKAIARRAVERIVQIALQVVRSAADRQIFYRNFYRTD